jgi:hypothetical protein
MILKDPGDLALERNVYNLIQYRIRNTQARINLTPHSNDNGHDIYVKGYREKDILGIPLQSQLEKDILIECKYSKHTRIPLSHISSNIIQTRPKKLTHYILVTNATLTPKTIHSIMMHIRDKKIDFRIIDLRQLPFLIPELVNNIYPSISIKKDLLLELDKTLKIDISYQLFSPNNYSDRRHHLVLLIRNYLDRQIKCEMCLHDDRNWSQIHTEVSANVIRPQSVSSGSIIFTSKSTRHHHRIIIRLRLDDQSVLLKIPVLEQKTFNDFPPLGTRLRENVNEVISDISTQRLPFLYLIHASSGLGKTRLVKEVCQRAARVVGSIVWWTSVSGGRMAQGISWPSRSKISTRTIVVDSELFTSLRQVISSSKNNFILVLDDVHSMQDSGIEALESLVFHVMKSKNSILLGMFLIERSDPTFKNSRFDVLVSKIVELMSKNPAQVRIIDNEKIQDESIWQNAENIIPAKCRSGLALLADFPCARPVDIIHYINSLLERDVICWIDESTLELTERGRNSTLIPFQETESCTSILEKRYISIHEIRCNGLSLSTIFTVLSTIKSPESLFECIYWLLQNNPMLRKVIFYWFEINETAKIGQCAHDTITEFLLEKFYDFNKLIDYESVLNTIPALRESLDDTAIGAIYLHVRKFKAASQYFTNYLQSLRLLKNISSLELKIDDYHASGCTIFLLANYKPRHTHTLNRAIIARAYIDVHALDFAKGLADCLWLLGRYTENLSSSNRKMRPLIAREAIRQMMAHSLLNAGDTNTSLLLMHRVDNALRNHPSSRLGSAVEFDMVDRLFTHYMRQSCFDVAREFVQRQKDCANRANDHILENLMLSNQFHLLRYVDCGEAEYAARNALIHAREFAPRRSFIHAEINLMISNWSMDQSFDFPIDTLASFRIEAIACGYGHLIPRIDYLMCFHRLRTEQASKNVSGQLNQMLKTVISSARSYGYGEYRWLAENMRLLDLISRRATHEKIKATAISIVAMINADGLTFIGGEHLCYQSPVVLSNAIRAIYVLEGAESATRAANAITFSPLLIGGGRARDEVLADVFDGDILTPRYDKRALWQNPQGYWIIPV